MRKIIVSILFLAMLSSSVVNAKEVKQKTDEELIAEIMQLDKEIEKSKVRNKALDELEKKVDELSEILQVDK